MRFIAERQLSIMDYQKLVIQQQRNIIQPIILIVLQLQQ